MIESESRSEEIVDIEKKNKKKQKRKLQKKPDQKTKEKSSSRELMIMNFTSLTHLEILQLHIYEWANTHISNISPLKNTTVAHLQVS